MRANLDDKRIQDKGFHVLPANFLNIPGLHMMGHAKFDHAFQILDEHYHPNCMEIMVIADGHQNFWVDGTKYPLYGCDVFTSYVNEGHSTGPDHLTVSEQLWFQLDLREPKGFLGLTSPLDRQLYQMVMQWNQRVAKVQPEDVERLRQAFDCMEAGTQKIRGFSLLLEFLTNLLAQEDRRASITEDIQNVIDAISTRISEQLTIKELAEYAGISESWLKRKFCMQMGISIREYINRQKVEKGKHLLVQKNYSVTEVANALGLSSSYFATMFRRYIGCTPKEYQRDKYPIRME